MRRERLSQGDPQGFDQDSCSVPFKTHTFPEHLLRAQPGLEVGRDGEALVWERKRREGPGPGGPVIPC